MHRARPVCGAIQRVRELTRFTRTLRLLFVWGVPFLDAVIALRVAAEESPDLMAGRGWFWDGIFSQIRH
jgi:type II secretory pathway component PulF